MAKKNKNETLNKLLNITIYKIKADSLEDAKKIYEKEVETTWLYVDDLNDKYVVKYDLTKSDKIESLEHDEIHPLDQYELSESIINKGKELGVKIGIHKEPTTINPESVKKFKELALKNFKKMKEKNKSKEPDKSEAKNEH